MLGRAKDRFVPASGPNDLAVGVDTEPFERLVVGLGKLKEVDLGRSERTDVLKVGVVAR
jgi:hypothetical protein